MSIETKTWWYYPSYKKKLVDKAQSIVKLYEKNFVKWLSGHPIYPANIHFYLSILVLAVKVFLIDAELNSTSNGDSFKGVSSGKKREVSARILFLCTQKASTLYTEKKA